MTFPEMKWATDAIRICHIRLFRQIKNLKEKGYQLKAIKHALNQVLEKEGRMELSDEILEKDMDAALKEFREEDKPGGLAEVRDGASVVSMEEKMAQFQQIMNLIIGRALEVNNEKLSQDISTLVNEKMGQELEYLLKDSDQKAEERFRRLDEALRSVQKDSQAEAAAAKIPIFQEKALWPQRQKTLGREKNKADSPISPQNRLKPLAIFLRPKFPYRHFAGIVVSYPRRQ